MRAVMTLLLLTMSMPLFALSPDDEAVIAATASLLASGRSVVLLSDRTAAYTPEPGASHQRDADTLTMLSARLRARQVERIASAPARGIRLIPAAEFQRLLDGEAAPEHRAVEVSLPAYSDDRRIAYVQYRLLKPITGGAAVRFGTALFERAAGGWMMRTRTTYMINYTSGTRPPMRVGGEVTPPQVISRVSPIYPDEARQARIQGIVIVETLIDENGRVVDSEILKDLPYGLGQAAVESIEQWQFRPGTFAGHPVPVIFNLTVNFRLD